MRVRNYEITAGTPPFEEIVTLDAFGFKRPRTDTTDAVAAGVFGKPGFCCAARDVHTAELVGYGYFNGWGLPSGDLLHISALITKPEYQKGVGRAIIKEALGVYDWDFLAFSTQSPVMYAAGSHYTELLYPALDGRPVPDEFTTVAEALLPVKDRLTYPLRKGLYGGEPLYGVRPEHPMAEAFYSYPGFNYENGDALFFVGRIATRS